MHFLSIWNCTLGRSVACVFRTTSLLESSPLLLLLACLTNPSCYASNWTVSPFLFLRSFHYNVLFFFLPRFIAVNVRPVFSVLHSLNYATVTTRAKYIRYSYVKTNTEFCRSNKFKVDLSRDEISKSKWTAWIKQPIQSCILMKWTVKDEVLLSKYLRKQNWTHTLKICGM